MMTAGRMLESKQVVTLKFSVGHREGSFGVVQDKAQRSGIVILLQGVETKKVTTVVNRPLANFHARS